MSFPKTAQRPVVVFSIRCNYCGEAKGHNKSVYLEPIGRVPACPKIPKGEVFPIGTTVVAAYEGVGNAEFIIEE